MVSICLQKPGDPPESSPLSISTIEPQSDAWAPVGEDGFDSVNVMPIIFRNVSLIDSQLADRVSFWKAHALGGPRELARSLSVASKSYDVWTGELRFEPMTLTVSADRNNQSW